MQPNTDHYFFRGGGEMGEQIRSKDWSRTPLGPPEDWPCSLRVMVSVMLENPFGMYIAWGKEYIQIYNDGYRPILGNNKHPGALGISTRETFSEIWHIIEPMFDGVMQGIPVGFPDFMLPLNRNGYIENCYFDFAYSPIRLDNGEVGGVLVTVTETTNKKKAEDALLERSSQLQFAIEATDLATWEIDPVTKRFTGDDRLKEWHGLPPGDEFDLEAGFNVVMNEDLQSLADAISHALEYSSGGKMDVQYKIVHPRTKKLRVVRAKGKVSFNEEKQPIRFMGTLHNVTDEVMANNEKVEKERNLRLMILQAPVGITILRGADYIMEIANARALEIWGKKEEEVLNKPVFESMPELLSQGIKELLDDVRETGQRYAIDELPVEFIKNGKRQQTYLNFSYEPLYDGYGQINGIMGIGIDVTPQVEARKKIEDSEKRYNLMLMQSPFAFLILKGERMVIQLANESMIEVLGKGHDILGKPLMEVLPELEGQAFPDLLNNVYKSGTPFSANEMPARLVRNNKSEDVYFNFVYQPYYEADNTISGVTVIAYDVTLSVMAKKKIEDSEKRFRNLIAQAVHPILILKGEDLVLEVANDALFHLWRVGTEAIGKPFLEILPEMKDQPYVDLLLDVYHNGATHIGNEQPAYFNRPNGDEYTLYFNFIYLPFREPDGSISGVLVQAYDVTDQVVARQHAEDSAKQFTTLANSIQNLAWMADGEGWIYWYNKQWYAYTGTNYEEMEGWGWKKVHHPDHVDRVVEFVTDAWKKKEPWELTFPLLGADGKYRWFLTRAVPILDANGKIINWIGTNTDIDEAKLNSETLKQAVQQRTLELKLANEALEEKNITLKKANKELESFAYISSHDLQEPLRKIQLFASQLMETEMQNLSEPGKSRFLRMRNSAARMQTLIQDLLVYSRTSVVDRNYITINLNDLIEEIKEDIKEELQQKNAVVETGSICEVKVIPFQFRQLLLNLISNSIKFSQKNINPRICIECQNGTKDIFNNEKLEPGVNYHCITYTDNGIGFEQHFSEKIFEVFQRLHGRDKYQGTGVGLAIVKKIVENHNGIITASGEINAGAKFNIYIPAAS